jgi:CRP-like cAMP-binding protein
MEAHMNLIPRVAPHARQNQLLAALPDSQLTRLQSQIELVELQLGDVLCEAGTAPAYVYFPITAIVSLLYTTREGSSCEIAVIGNEGVVGVSLFMGGHTTPSEAVVQSGGQAFRLGAKTLKSELAEAGATLKILLSYTDSLIAQIGQTAACNRFHSIDQQLSRRLLLGLDRTSGKELVMTHELVASLLGVRREGVTAAALKLQQAGVISYRRGHITVLDRMQLEKRACECYAVASPARRRLFALAMAA